MRLHKKNKGRTKYLLLSLTHYSDLYGANKSLITLHLEFKKRNERTLIVCPDYGPLTRHLESQDIDFIVWPFKSLYTNLNAKAFSAVLKSLCKLFVNLYLVFALFIKLSLKGVAIRLVHSNSRIIDYGPFLSKILGVKHIWHIREYGDLDYGLKHGLGVRYFSFLLRNSDFIIGISRSIIDSVRQATKICPSRFSLIYNGVYVDAGIESPPLKKNGPFVFSIVGFISPNKGQEFAIETFLRLFSNNQNVELWVAGSGESSYVSYLQDRFQLRAEKNVKLLGYVDEVGEVLQRTDVLLMCSNYEAFGRVTVEALSYGVPVICNNTGGSNEIVMDGVNGFLYSSQIDLQKQMNHVVFNQEIKEMVAACKASAQKFTVTKYFFEFDKLVKRCAEV